MFLSFYVIVIHIKYHQAPVLDMKKFDFTVTGILQYLKNKLSFNLRRFYHLTQQIYTDVYNNVIFILTAHTEKPAVTLLHITPCVCYALDSIWTVDNTPFSRHKHFTLYTLMTRCFVLVVKC